MEVKNTKRETATTRFIGPRRKWASARCMEITPPRCPRDARGSASVRAFRSFAESSRCSKFTEESKASSTSCIERAVIGVAHQIYAPAFTHPPAPGYGYRLAFEISKVL